MGSLVLVRHAQGSFFEPDYDVLSPIGEMQAQKLGDYWAGLARPFDQVYTGPRMRHRRTAELAGQRVRRAGRAWPEPVVLNAFDEHAVDGLLREEPLRALGATHAGLRPLAQAYQNAGTRLEKHKTFQRLFEAIVRLWCQDGWTIEAVEPWVRFRDRVRAALEGLVEAKGSGRTIAIFTSVGPISVALGWALRCADLMALEVGWRVRNASLTEMVFTRGRVTLDSLNSLPHLDRPELWTYR